MKKILYIFAVAAAALAAGEICARCFLVNLSEIETRRSEIREGVSKELSGLLPKTGWLNKVGRHASGETPGVSETVLDSGQRASGPVKANPRKRVLLVGCSWLYGMGLRDEETLAALLNRHYSDVQFDNYGVPGFGTYQCCMTTDYLFGIGKQYDLVIYCFMNEHIFRQEMYHLSCPYTGNLNKYFVVNPRGEFVGGALRLYPSDSFDWPGQNTSALIYYLHAQRIAFSVRKYEKYYMGTDTNMLGEVRSIVGGICAMHSDLCGRNGSKFAVASLTESEIDWPCAVYDLSFKEICEPKFANLGKPNNHPNCEAQKIWLEKLIPCLDEALR